MIDKITAFLLLALGVVAALFKRENTAKKEAQEAMRGFKERLEEVNKSVEIQTDLDKHLADRREIEARNKKIRDDNLKTLKEFSNENDIPSANLDELIKLLNNKDKD